MNWLARLIAWLKSRGGRPSPPEPAPIPFPPPTPIPGDVNAQLLDAHNRIRIAHGLPPFQAHPKPVAMADSWAREMAASRTMSHDGREQRAAAFGLDPRKSNENVAKGHRAVEEAVAGWMDSPGHRANILSRAWTHFGGSVAQSDTNYWAAEFAQLP